MILQRIIYPLTAEELKNISSDDKLISEMYFRENFPNEILFNTYINSFFIERWKKYTIIDNLTVSVFLDKDCDATLSLFHMRSAAHKVVEKKLRTNEEIISNDCDFPDDSVVQHKIHLLELPDEGFIYLRVRYNRFPSFFQAYYESTVSHTLLINNVNLAIAICTYKRQDALISNLEMLNRSLKTINSLIPLDKLKIYVIDNGKTLHPSEINNEYTRVIFNKNCGGSSGFTRAMIEALSSGDAHTHIILMDDDIILPAGVIEANYVFLKLLKEEYRDYTIGGSMIEKERPYILYESGAFYNIRKYCKTAYCNGLDLRFVENILDLQTERNVNYSGWWYSCFPISDIKKKGFPMPFFIHFDDIEYGIRKGENRIIFLNSIFVWHPNIIGKAPIWDSYYVRRNSLITVSFGKIKCPFSRIFMTQGRVLVRNLLRYRYDEVRYELKAIRDYCKGPDYLKSQDPEILHRRLIKTTTPYPCKKLSECKEEFKVPLYHKCRKTEYFLQLICLLLPPSSQKLITDGSDRWLPYRIRTIYQVKNGSNEARILQRNHKEAMKLVLDYIRIMYFLCNNYKILCEEWEKASEELVSEEFWKKLLLI